MKRRWYISIALLLALSGSVWCQKITKDSLLSEGKKHTYYIYVPASVKPETPAPLMILLHGSNHVGLSLADKWKDLAAKEGFIMVAPDSLDSAVWAIPDDGPVFMRDLVEAMKGKYPVNPRRVYLFGHSGGAGFGLLMALYESQYFAGVAIHAGALDSAGTKLIGIAKRKTPIHLQVGNMDPLYPVQIVRETRDSLKTAGFPVELKEIPNHDHWYYDIAPRINQTAWEFLKRYELPEEPVFEAHNFKKETREAKDAKAAGMHYNRGVERLNAGDLPGAVTAFTRSIELDASQPDAYNNRGVAYSRQKNYDAALADFTRSIEAKPTESAFVNRAGIYFGLKRLDEALSDYSEVIKLNPMAENYASRGVVYAQNGKPDLALADYERAIQVDPKFGRSYMLRGLLKANKGDVEAAFKDFELGFKLDPQLHQEFDPLVNQIKTAHGMK